MADFDLAHVRRVLHDNTRGPDARWTMRGLSLKAGLNRDAVRDLLEGRSKDPGLDTLTKLAQALGGDLSLFLPGAANDLVAEGEFVEVRGSVAAGVWRADSEWPEESRYRVILKRSPVPRDRRFALRVDGESMNLVFPSGTILDCVSAIGFGLEPQSGDFVIVERVRKDGQRELTVKQWHVDDEGRKWLMARSTKPEFQAPIPAHDGDPDIEEQKVCAYVIGTYSETSLFRRLELELGR